MTGMLRRWLTVGVAMTAPLMGGCPEFTGPQGGGTVSDVPCLTPTEWSSEPGFSVYRAESSNTDTILFTAQTEDQFSDDIADGSRDFLPHQAVYLLDPESGEFSVVDNLMWDAAEGAICTGCPLAIHGGPLEIQDGRLLFNGGVIAVAGRRAVRIFDATVSECGSVAGEPGDVAAVLSIDGYVALLGASTGQHYHQLFSNVDGSQIGPTVRLAIGGLQEGSVRACWTSDREYVVYDQGTQESPTIGRICVVAVAEALAGLEGE